MGSEVSHDELDQEVVEDLRDNTKFTNSEISDMYERFKSDFPSGVITRDKFVQLYSSMYPHGNAVDFAQHLFRAYDRDKNGEINFQEFMRTVSVASKGSVDEKLKWAFNLYDQDGNGVVSRDEVTRMISAIYRMQGETQQHEAVEESALQIFVCLDKNKDDGVSEQEFIAAAKNSNAIANLLS